MSCEQTYLIEIGECPETIIVAAGLQGNQHYSYLFTDKNGLEYYESVVTDSAGSFVVDCSIFPAGMLNRASGYLTLEVFPLYSVYYNFISAVPLTFCGDLYDSVTITFSSRTPSNVIQYIKCI